MWCLHMGFLEFLVDLCKRLSFIFLGLVIALAGCIMLAYGSLFGLIPAVLGMAMVVYARQSKSGNE